MTHTNSIADMTQAATAYARFIAGASYPAARRGQGIAPMTTRELRLAREYAELKHDLVNAHAIGEILRANVVLAA